jgi:uncharacterized protein (TIGR03435 family)
MINDDMELLREFVTRQSDRAFETLVTRYINLVYSTALRQVRDPHLAEEITQAVFIILARKAGLLGAKTILPSWLHRTAVFAAADVLKQQRRREHREQEARMKSEMQTAAPDPAWELISPLLDEALVQLGDKDRQAVVLHFFQKKTFAEVGGVLGMTEDTARRRTNRALEKLRKIFSRHGVNSTTAILSGGLAANSLQLAPALLAKSVTAVALTKGATAAGSTLILTQETLKIMAWTKTKIALAAAVCLLLAGGATTIVIEKERDARLEKIWRINKDLPMAVIDKLPPMVKMLPTKFGPPWINYSAGSHGDKFAGARARAPIVAMYAYNVPLSQMRFDCDCPTNRYDFIATLPHGNAEALQRELKKKLGLVGHREMTNLDVLALRVVSPNAPGLKPGIYGKEDCWWKAGGYHASSRPIDSGAPRFEGLSYFLEDYFGRPVIDQTGLGTRRFNLDLRWKEAKWGENPDGLKQVLRERLGLEVVPTNLPMEILVMEKES